MEYKFTRKSISHIEVERNSYSFEIIPNSFRYYKTKYRVSDKTKKVIRIKFRWLLWSYQLVILKPL